MKPVKKIRNKLFELLHPGRKVYCLYCDKWFGKFLHSGVKSPVFKKYKVAGGGYKTNMRCPNCGSGPRARVLALFFKLRTEAFTRPTQILHISPNNAIADLLASYPSVTQVVGAYEPEQFRQYNPLKLDVQDMPLQSNMFDVVICCHVIEHVDDDEKAMREIHRVLKPGGFAVLQVPIAINLEKTLEDKTLKTDKERKLAHGQVDHVRLYGLDYFTKLEKNGFRVVRDNPFTNNWLKQEELEKHRLDPLEDVIVAYKD